MLTQPKRLFDIHFMKTVMYDDVKSDVEKNGYVAISHVWGKQKKYWPILLGIRGGVNWNVPLSRRDKMGQMKKSMKQYGMRYCWWDILCMNQDKQDEINQEIPMMGDYYKGSKMTLVLSDIKYVFYKDFEKWNNIVYNAAINGRCLSITEQMWMDRYDDTNDLLNIHQDEWFNRVWTFQEAVMPRRLILVDIDDYHLNLSDLMAKILYIIEENSSRIVHMFGKSWIELINISGAIKS